MFGGVISLAMFAALPVQASAGLRDLASTKNLRFGCAVEVRPLMLEAEYQSAVASECGALTPANALKFDAVHPESNIYDFSGGDSILNFARQHGQELRGHTLVWHQALPRWVSRSVKTRDQAVAVLRDHIMNVAGHYRGEVYAWDVVNEAVNDEGTGLRSSLWRNTIGPEYIALAFQWAHEADSNAKLCYNDYGAEGMNQKSDAIYALVKDLKDKNIPIHCVGLQMHLSQEEALDYPAIAQNMQRLAALGVEVHVTELDVRIQKPFTDQKRHLQAEIYSRVLSLCLQQPSCTTFNLWGITDKYSWVSRTFKKWGEALILDRNFVPKPAYYSLQTGLQ